MSAEPIVVKVAAEATGFEKLEEKLEKAKSKIDDVNKKKINLGETDGEDTRMTDIQAMLDDAKTLMQGLQGFNLDSNFIDPINSGINGILGSISKLNSKKIRLDPTQANIALGILGAKVNSLKQTVSAASSAFSGLEEKDIAKINAASGTMQQWTADVMHTKSNRKLSAVGLAEQTRNVHFDELEQLRRATGMDRGKFNALLEFTARSVKPRGNTENSFLNDMIRFSNGVVKPYVSTEEETFIQKLPRGYFEFLQGVKSQSPMKEFHAFAANRDTNPLAEVESAIKIEGEKPGLKNAHLYGQRVSPKEWEAIVKESQSNILLRNAMVSMGLAQYSGGRFQAAKWGEENSINKLMIAQLASRMGQKALPSIEGSELYRREIVDPDSIDEYRINKLDNVGARQLVSGLKVIMPALSAVKEDGSRVTLDPIMLQEGSKYKRWGKDEKDGKDDKKRELDLVMSDVSDAQLVPKHKEYQTTVFTIDDILNGKTADDVRKKDVSKSKTGSGFIMKGESALLRMLGINQEHNSSQDAIIYGRTSDALLAQDETGKLMYEEDGSGRPMLNPTRGAWEDRFYKKQTIGNYEYVPRMTNKDGLTQFVRADLWQGAKQKLGTSINYALAEAESLGITFSEAEKERFKADAQEVDPLYNFANVNKEYEKIGKVLEASARLDTPTTAISEYGLRLDPFGMYVLDEELIAEYTGKKALMDGGALIKPGSKDDPRHFMGSENLQMRIGPIKTGATIVDWVPAILKAFGAKDGQPSTLTTWENGDERFLVPRRGIAKAKTKLIEEALKADKELPDVDRRGVSKVLEGLVGSGQIGRDDVIDMLDPNVKGIISYGSAKNLNWMFDDENGEGVSSDIQKARLAAALFTVGGAGVMETAATKQYGGRWIPGAIASKIGLTDVDYKRSNSAAVKLLHTIDNDEQALIDYVFSGDTEEDKAVRADPSLIYSNDSLKTRINETRAAIQYKMNTGGYYEKPRSSNAPNVYTGLAAFTNPFELIYAGREMDVVDKDFFDATDLTKRANETHSRIVTGQVGDDALVAMNRAPTERGESRTAINRRKQFAEALAQAGMSMDMNALYLASEEMNAMGGGDWDVDTVNILQGKIVESIKIAYDTFDKVKNETKETYREKQKQKNDATQKGKVGDMQALKNQAEQIAQATPMMATAFNASEALRAYSLRDEEELAKWMPGLLDTNKAYTENTVYAKTGEYIKTTPAMRKMLSEQKPFQSAFKDVVGAFVKRNADEEDQVEVKDISRVGFASLYDPSAILALTSMADFSVGDGVYQHLIKSQKDVQKTYSGLTVRDVLEGGKGNKIDIAQAEYLNYMNTLQGKQFIGAAQIIADEDLNTAVDLLTNFETLAAEADLSIEERQRVKSFASQQGHKIGSARDHGNTETNVKSGKFAGAAWLSGKHGRMSNGKILTYDKDNKQWVEQEGEKDILAEAYDEKQAHLQAMAVAQMQNDELLLSEYTVRPFLDKMRTPENGVITWSNLSNLMPDEKGKLTAVNVMESLYRLNGDRQKADEIRASAGSRFPTGSTEAGTAAHKTFEDWGNLRKAYDAYTYTDEYKNSGRTRSAEDFEQWFRDLDETSKVGQQVQIGSKEERAGMSIGDFFGNRYKKYWNGNVFNSQHKDFDSFTPARGKALKNQFERTYDFMSTGLAAMLLDKDFLGSELWLEGSLGENEYDPLGRKFKGSGVTDVVMRDRKTGELNLYDYKPGDPLNGPKQRKYDMQQALYTSFLNEMFKTKTTVDENGLYKVTDPNASREFVGFIESLNGIMKANGAKADPDKPTTVAEIGTVSHNNVDGTGKRIRTKKVDQAFLDESMGEITAAANLAQGLVTRFGFDPSAIKNFVETANLTGADLSQSGNLKLLLDSVKQSGEAGAFASNIESQYVKARARESRHIESLKMSEKTGEAFAIAARVEQDVSKKESELEGMQNSLIKDFYGYKDEKGPFNKWSTYQKKLNDDYDRERSELENAGASPERLNQLDAARYDTRQQFRNTLLLAADGDVTNLETQLNDIVNGTKKNSAASGYEKAFDALTTSINNAKDAYETLQAELDSEKSEAKTTASKKYDDEINDKQASLIELRKDLSQYDGKKEEDLDAVAKDEVARLKNEIAAAEEEIKKAEESKKGISDHIDEQFAAKQQMADNAKQHYENLTGNNDARANGSGTLTDNAYDALFNNSMSSLSAKYGSDILASNPLFKAMSTREAAIKEYDGMSAAVGKKINAGEITDAVGQEYYARIEQEKAATLDALERQRAITQENSLNSLQSDAMYARRSFYSNGILGRSYAQAEMNSMKARRAEQVYDNLNMQSQEAQSRYGKSSEETSAAREAFKEAYKNSSLYADRHFSSPAAFDKFIDETLKDKTATYDGNKQLAELKGNYLSSSDKTDQLGKNAAGLAEQAKTAKGAMEELQAASNPVNTTIANLSQSFARLSMQIGRRMFRKAIQEAKQFIQQYDTAMNQIQMITMKSDSEMAQVSNSTISKALSSKQSIANVANTKAALYRQGLSDTEMNGRLDTILQFATVAGVKVEAATKIMTTAMQNGLVSSVQEASDAFVALGDNAATTAEEIAKAYQKVAATAATSDVSNAELMSLITFGTSNTQLSGQQIGTALNTIFTRTRKVTANNFVKDQNGEITSINDVEKALGTAGIAIREDNDTFRSTYDILRDIGLVWNELSDVQQSMITNAMAGTRQTNVFQTLMQGIADDGGETLDKYLGLASDSNGITADKYEIAMESISASLTNVKNAFDAFIISMTDNGTITGILDTIADFFQALAEGADSAAGSIAQLAVIAGPIVAILTTIAGLAVGGPVGAILGGLAGVAGLGAAAGIGKLAANSFNESDTQKHIKKAEEYAAAADRSKDRADENKQIKKQLTDMKAAKTKDEYEKALGGLKDIAPDMAASFETMKFGSKELTSAIDENIASVSNLISVYSNLSKEQNAASAREQAKAQSKATAEAWDKALNAGNIGDLFKSERSALNYAIMDDSTGFAKHLRETRTYNEGAFDSIIEQAITHARGNIGEYSFLAGYTLDEFTKDLKNGDLSEETTGELMKWMRENLFQNISPEGVGSRGFIYDNGAWYDAREMPTDALLWDGYLNDDENKLPNGSAFLKGDINTDTVWKAAKEAGRAHTENILANYSGWLYEGIDPKTANILIEELKKKLLSDVDAADLTGIATGDDYVDMVDKMVPEKIGEYSEQQMESAINLEDDIVGAGVLFTNSKYQAEKSYIVDENGNKVTFANTDNGNGKEIVVNGSAEQLQAIVDAYNNGTGSSESLTVAEDGGKLEVVEVDSPDGKNDFNSLSYATQAAYGAKGKGSKNYMGTAMTLKKAIDFASLRTTRGENGEFLSSTSSNIDAYQNIYGGLEELKGLYDDHPILAQAQLLMDEGKLTTSQFYDMIDETMGLSPLGTASADAYVAAYRKALANDTLNEFYADDNWSQLRANAVSQYSDFGAYEKANMDGNQAGIDYYGAQIDKQQQLNELKRKYATSQYGDEITNKISSIQQGGTAAAGVYSDAYSELTAFGTAQKARRLWVAGKDINMSEAEWNALAKETGCSVDALKNMNVALRRTSQANKNFQMEQDRVTEMYQGLYEDGGEEMQSVIEAAGGKIVDGKVYMKNLNSDEMTYDQMVAQHKLITQASDKRHLYARAANGEEAAKKTLMEDDSIYAALSGWDKKQLLDTYVSNQAKGKLVSNTEYLGQAMTEKFGEDWGTKIGTMGGAAFSKALFDDPAFNGIVNALASPELLETMTRFENGMADGSEVMATYNTALGQEHLTNMGYGDLAGTYGGLMSNKSSENMAAKSSIAQQRYATQKALYYVDNIDTQKNFQGIADYLGISEKEVMDIYGRDGGKDELKKMVSEKAKEMKDGVMEMMNTILKEANAGFSAADYLSGKIDKTQLTDAVGSTLADIFAFLAGEVSNWSKPEGDWNQQLAEAEAQRLKEIRDSHTLQTLKDIVGGASKEEYEKNGYKNYEAQKEAEYAAYVKKEEGSGGVAVSQDKWDRDHNKLSEDDWKAENTYEKWMADEINRRAEAEGLDGTVVGGEVAALIRNGAAQEDLMSFIDYKETGNIGISPLMVKAWGNLMKTFRETGGAGVRDEILNTDDPISQILYNALLEQVPELAEVLSNPELADTKMIDANAAVIGSIADNSNEGDDYSGAYKGIGQKILSSNAETREEGYSAANKALVDCADRLTALNMEEKGVIPEKKSSNSGPDYRKIMEEMAASYTGGKDYDNFHGDLTTGQTDEMRLDTLKMLNEAWNQGFETPAVGLLKSGEIKYADEYNEEGIDFSLADLHNGKVFEGLSEGMKAFIDEMYAIVTNNGANSDAAKDMRYRTARDESGDLLFETVREVSKYMTDEQIAEAKANGAEITTDEGKKITLTKDDVNEFTGLYEKYQSGAEMSKAEMERMEELAGNINAVGDAYGIAGEKAEEYDAATQGAAESTEALDDASEGAADSSENLADSNTNVAKEVKKATKEMTKSARGMEDFSAEADATGNVEQNIDFDGAVDINGIDDELKGTLQDAANQAAEDMSNTEFTAEANPTIGVETNATCEDTGVNVDVSNAADRVNGITDAMKASDGKSLTITWTTDTVLGEDGSMTISAAVNGTLLDFLAGLKGTGGGSGGGGGKKGGGGGGGGGGKGKTKAQKLLKRLGNADDIYKHNVTIAEKLGEKYQKEGKLENYGVMLQEQKDLKTKRIDQIKDHMAQIEKMQTTVKYGSDDWASLTEQLRKYEEEVYDTQMELIDLDDAMEENRKAILETKKTLESNLANTFADIDQREKDMVSGAADMESTILDIIKQRYQGEWDLMKEDIERKKQALQDEISLIDERMNARKKASDEESKIDELNELRRQYAMISTDGSRTKEARELEEKINNLQKEITEQQMTNEDEYQKQLLQEESDNYDKYSSDREEALEKLLEDANNFSEEVTSILGLSQEDLLSWLESNDEEYKNSLENTQKTMVESWKDTYNQMLDIVITYWDDIEKIIGDDKTEEGRLAYIEKMKNSDEYKEAKTDADRAALEKKYSDDYTGKTKYMDTLRLSSDYRNASEADKATMEMDWSKQFDDRWNAKLPATITGSTHNATTENEDSYWYTTKNLKLYEEKNLKKPMLNSKGKQIYLPKMTGDSKNPKDIMAYSNSIRPNGGEVDRGRKWVQVTYKGLTGYVVMADTSKDSGLKEFVKPKVDLNQVTKNEYGGLVDYTGLAQVDGTPLRPEAFLDADDTRVMREFLDTAKVLKFNPSIYNVGSESFGGTTTTIGDISVVIQEASISSDEDYNTIATKVGEAIVKNLSHVGMNMANYSL